MQQKVARGVAVLFLKLYWVRYCIEALLRTGLQCAVEISESIQCPFCGQESTVSIDTSQPSQRFTSDCEVCCRPFEVTVECEAGEILSLDVAPG